MGHFGLPSLSGFHVFMKEQLRKGIFYSLFGVLSELEWLATLNTHFRSSIHVVLLNNNCSHTFKKKTTLKTDHFGHLKQAPHL